MESPSQEVPSEQRGICGEEEEVFLFIMNLSFFLFLIFLASTERHKASS